MRCPLALIPFQSSLVESNAVPAATSNRWHGNCGTWGNKEATYFIMHTHTHMGLHTRSPFTTTLTEALNPNCCEKSPPQADYPEAKNKNIQSVHLNKF